MLYRMWRKKGLLAVAASLITLVGLLAIACSGQGRSGADGKVVQVVAAEDFWGSIAAQVGGSHVQVVSIIRDPNTDPHDFEPTAKDARSVADARYVVYNGAGLDPWVDRLLRASPSSGRRVLNIGEFLGKREGDDPHLWYSPDYVTSVAVKIRDDLKAIDPSNASQFDRSEQQFIEVGLKQYRALVDEINSKYGGTPVGATEGLFSYLASALGLKLVTPASYLSAVSEGMDVTASDQAAVEAQIDQGLVKILVYNSQNTPPNVQALLNRARAKGIPVATITETLKPAGAVFQDWQSAQLQGIADALRRATGK